MFVFRVWCTYVSLLPEATGRSHAEPRRGDGARPCHPELYAKDEARRWHDRRSWPEGLGPAGGPLGGRSHKLWAQGAQVKVKGMSENSTTERGPVSDLSAIASATAEALREG